METSLLGDCHELLQNSDLTLVENGLSIEEIGDRKVKVRLFYCDHVVEVIVVKEEPLDFVIVPSEIISMDILQNEMPPDFPRTTLAQLLTWIMTKLKTSMKERLNYSESVSFLSDTVDKLINGQVIEEKDYQIVVSNEKAVLLLKFPLQERLDLPTLKLDKENRILSCDQQYFMVWLAFKLETGQLLVPELCVSFSSCLRDSLPELDGNTSIPSLDKHLRSHDLVHSVLFIKETVMDMVARAHMGWLARAKLLMSLYGDFSIEQGFGAMVLMDTVAMTKFQVAFSLGDIGKMMLAMELTTQYPATVPKCVLHHQKPGQETLQSMALTNSCTKMTTNMTAQETRDAFITLLDTIVERYCDHPLEILKGPNSK